MKGEWQIVLLLVVFVLLYSLATYVWGTWYCWLFWNRHVDAFFSFNCID